MSLVSIYICSPVVSRGAKEAAQLPVFSRTMLSPFFPHLPGDTDNAEVKGQEACVPGYMQAQCGAPC